MRTEIVKSFMIIGLALALLWFLVQIGIHGSHQIQEPSGPILAAELLLIFGLVIFGIADLVRGKH